MPKTFNGEVIYSATDIKKMLATKHKGDMFFTEVKNGPTQVVAHHARIDALAMTISWTRFGIIGYEIKVARSDFLRDQKWQAYLPMCHQLYFVTAPGVCDVSEIPEPCGLMTITKSGNLRTVKKAPWREIEMPINMLLYLMFTYIGPYGMMDSKLPRWERLMINQRAELFRAYLDDKAEWKEIGYRLPRKLRDQMEELRRENSRMKNAYEDSKRYAEQLGAVCKALGVRQYGWNVAGNCVTAIEAMKQNGGMTPSMEQAVVKLKADAEILLREFEQRKSGGNVP